MATDRVAEISKWIKRIEKSGLSVATFFETRRVPFSRAQYFIYKRRLQELGPDGLTDQRTIGGNRKLASEHLGFLKGCIKGDPNISLGELQQSLLEEFQCDVSLRSISRVLAVVDPGRKGNRGRPRKPESAHVALNSLGGFELIVAVAYHLGWPQRTADVIAGVVDSLKRSKEFKVSRRRANTAGKNRAGEFTRRYNQRRDVKRNRFASISDKRQSKNWQSMNIVHDGHETILRKSLALLSLPVVSNNGQTRSVNTAYGQSLGHLCGFNYKQSSITKHLAELKYLGVSTALLQDLPEFWKLCWRDAVTDAMMGPLLCYYIDGNTKALWSSSRVKKNKVTMLGRVMGCVEQVFIHDGLGHPVYFENYSGHGPTGEHVLGLFEKIEDAILDVPGSRARVFRAIVMDGANNSVRCLRAFAEQELYHYISTLDDNQWDERRVRSSSCRMRYRYGAATLRDVEIELEDSQDKGYVLSARAIVVTWDNGRQIVVVTSLPKSIVDANEVVYSYFRRWPSQELSYRYEKATVCLNRVAGYGRKRVTNPRQREKQEKLARKIGSLTDQLQYAIEARTAHEQEIAKLIPKERRLRAKTRLVDGKRIVPRSIRADFERCGKEIRRHERAIRNIEKPHKEEFRQLRKCQREWLRLQGKETEYAVDVELDQILTYFRASLVHLYAYFINYFLDGQPLSLIGLASRILQLSATIEEQRDHRKIVLQRNAKDPTMMNRLQGAIDKLNNLKVIGPRGKVMSFCLE
jgi:hypothetical protein